jgi:predicted AlkP superfamily phosphohydrolase/phosphomutase
VAVAPFYETLSDAGIRSAVVDFPVDYPIEGFNGIQVVDWATEFKLWHFETRPKNLAAQLVTKYGRHPLMNYPGTRATLAGLLALKRKLTQGIEIKRQFAVDLIQMQQHEFIFFGFSELHKAGHFFWRFHDRTHPEFTDAEPELVDSLRAMYEEMDRALGSVMSQLNNEDGAPFVEILAFATALRGLDDQRLSIGGASIDFRQDARGAAALLPDGHWRRSTAGLDKDTRVSAAERR